MLAGRADAQIGQGNTIGVEQAKNIVIGGYQKFSGIGKCRVLRKLTGVAMPMRGDDWQVLTH